MPSDYAKAVHKVEVEGEDEMNLGSLRNKKLSNGSTPKGSKAKKVTKEESDDDFEQPSSKKSSNKPSDKGQKKKKQEDGEKRKKKGAKEPEKMVKKREKQVYNLPGQRRDPPEERDPLRIFYETLYKQVPNSEMAAIWMMESGLLPKELAKKVFEKKQKKVQGQRLVSPAKTVVTLKERAESIIIKKKTSTSSISAEKKKTADTKVVSKQSKTKRQRADSSSDDGADEDDDFVVAKKAKKTQSR